MDRRASVSSSMVGGPWFCGPWRRGVRATIAAAALFAGTLPAHAQSLPASMAQAYQINPQLNAARAGQRATDEGVPQALAGYRPQIIGTLSAGLAGVRNLLPDNTIQTAT